MLVSCVIVKTKTRSKNSSSVLTRSGGSASGRGSLCDVMPVPAAAHPHGFHDLVGGRARGGEVRPGPHRVEHPSARGHQVGPGPGGAGVEEITTGPFGMIVEVDLVALDRSRWVALGRDHHRDG